MDDVSWQPSLVPRPKLDGLTDSSSKGANTPVVSSRETERYLNLASWIPCTQVEGPGRRFALWTQGCLLRCPGCCNPGMFALVPRMILPVKDVIEKIQRAHQQFDLDGVTFLGGEPILQAQGLAIVAEACQTMNLSVMLFTGYCLEQLQAMPLAGVPELLRHCDIVVDGPYMEELPDEERNWVGSQNQRFHFLTSRYAPGIEYDRRYRPAVEFRVLRSGQIIYNGSPIRPKGSRPKRASSSDVAGS